MSTSGSPPTPANGTPPTNASLPADAAPPAEVPVPTLPTFTRVRTKLVDAVLSTVLGKLLAGLLALLALLAIRPGVPPLHGCFFGPAVGAAADAALPDGGGSVLVISHDSKFVLFRPGPGGPTYEGTEIDTSRAPEIFVRLRRADHRDAGTLTVTPTDDAESNVQVRWDRVAGELVEISMQLHGRDAPPAMLSGNPAADSPVATTGAP